jgi:hypothetical protein
MAHFDVESDMEHNGGAFNYESRESSEDGTILKMRTVMKRMKVTTIAMNIVKTMNIVKMKAVMMMMNMILAVM